MFMNKGGGCGHGIDGVWPYQLGNIVITHVGRARVPSPRVSMSVASLHSFFMSWPIPTVILLFFIKKISFFSIYIFLLFKHKYHPINTHNLFMHYTYNFNLNFNVNLQTLRTLMASSSNAHSVGREMKKLIWQTSG